MNWLPGAALVIALLVLMCGAGLGYWGVDSRDGRDWKGLPREDSPLRP